MTTNTLDKHKGIETLNAAIEIIRNEIGSRGGSLNVKMEPKAVSLHEERELNLMMERYETKGRMWPSRFNERLLRLEMENRQVDGDAAEDD